MMKTIDIQYFAVLREQAGKVAETLHTEAATPAAVYAELQARHGFTIAPCALKVAVNDDFAAWDCLLGDGDRLVFIPPVAGG
jgi:molybdopterin converting factor small subunit